MEERTGWLRPGPTSNFKKANIPAARYFKRIARPIVGHIEGYPGLNPESKQLMNTILVATAQLANLTSQLENICQTVHPHEANLDTYGHNIRNLLILACTEVEAQWTGILRANEIQKTRLNTKDYVKLSAAMRLPEYAVRFPLMPWLPPTSPFADWRVGGEPTKDLPWYHAYNKAKHDRESEFREATLKHVFDALAAIYVMLIAQYGNGFRHENRYPQQAFYIMSTWPEWPAVERYIVPSQFSETNRWEPVAFDFEQ